MKAFKKSYKYHGLAVYQYDGEYYVVGTRKQIDKATKFFSKYKKIDPNSLGTFPKNKFAYKLVSIPE